jgi:protein involved in polysaccharide export with SLBB domain
MPNSSKSPWVSGWPLRLCATAALFAVPAATGARPPESPTDVVQSPQPTDRSDGEGGESDSKPYVIEPPDVIRIEVRKLVPHPKMKDSLPDDRGRIAGNHLIAPDGTIELGRFGRVSIAGLKVLEAALAIDAHLAKHFADAGVIVRVEQFNSKVFYIVRDGVAGEADRIWRMPATGKETVLDALAAAGGELRLGDTTRVWIVRSGGKPKDTIILIDLPSVHKDPKANPRLLPGDRLFVR